MIHRVEELIVTNNAETHISLWKQTKLFQFDTNGGFMSLSTNRLVFEIELAKQKLQYAIDSKLDTLVFETQRQLANLNEMLLHSVSRCDPSRAQVYFLVFSEEHQDGKVMTLAQYREAQRLMIDTDLKTHVAIEIDGPIDLVGAVEQVLLLENTSKKDKKSA